ELLNPTIADVGNGDDFRIFFTQRIDVDESIFGQGLDDGVAFNLPLDRDYRGNANATLASDTLENGNIVVALDRDGFNGRDEQILVMIMTPGGNIVRQFNIGSSNDQQFQPVVTALTGGGFVVAFGENDGDRDPVFQVFAANGDAVSGLREYGTEAVAARSGNDDPAIAALEDGGFVAFYDDDIANQIRGQRFDAEGNEVGDEFVVANDAGSQLDATLLADGRVAISYFVPDEGVVKTAIVEGTPGQIILPGTIADDELTGTNAGETILGFGGADTIEGFGGADSIDGGNGNDQIDGGSGADTIDGGNGNDVIDGGGGWDTLNGGSGQDSLNGSFGSDILNGGAGNDILIGGGGRDDFVFAGNFGDDTITDFDARNNNEDIDLSGVDGIDSFADLAGALSQQGDDVVIDLAGGSITLENVALADLNANDFLF
ncbi:MAG: calcium-binding protein, partial [Pseudomonadota bacterium]